MTERDEQKTVFAWAHWQGNLTPELDALYAVPNGQVRPGQVLEPGIKRGVPDICLPVPRGEFGALYIELKFGQNKVSNNQAKWIERLGALGNRVEVCYGAQEAIDVIKDYLEIE